MKALHVSLTVSDTITKEFVKTVEVPDTFDADDEEEVGSLVDYLHTLDLGDPIEEWADGYETGGEVEDLTDVWGSENAKPTLRLMRTHDGWCHQDIAGEPDDQPVPLSSLEQGQGQESTN